MTTNQQKEYQRRWHAKHDGPKGVIGKVQALAPGAINPMWQMTESVEQMAELIAKKAPLLVKSQKKIIPTKTIFEKTIEPEEDEA